MSGSPAGLFQRVSATCRDVLSYRRLWSASDPWIASSGMPDGSSSPLRGKSGPGDFWRLLTIAEETARRDPRLRCASRHRQTHTGHPRNTRVPHGKGA